MRTETRVWNMIALLDVNGYRITVPSVRKYTKVDDEDLIRKTIEEYKRQREREERIAAQKAQPNVYQIEMTVNWGASGTYGRQAQATARVQLQDGSWHKFVGRKTGGAGYDKESSAISYVFSDFMLGMLWRKRVKQGERLPYGCRVDKKFGAYYDYGVGTECYRRIVEWLGGEWRHVSNGKHHDSWMITFKRNKPKK